MHAPSYGFELMVKADEVWDTQREGDTQIFPPPKMKLAVLELYCLEFMCVCFLGVLTKT